MAHRLGRSILLGLLIVAGGVAHAQDETLQSIYSALEQSARADYEALRTSLSREAMVRALDASKEREELKMLSYNKTVLFASCVADDDRGRSPTAPRVPAEQNLVLRTCVEIKLAELRKFSERRAYAEVFFPERIERCGEAARRRELETQLPAFDFLELSEPRLYDFARYNQCLMTVPKGEPATRPRSLNK